MELNVAHVLGFPIDFNGNLQRALSEAIHTARHGAKVNFLVSKEAARSVWTDILAEEYNDSLDIKIFPLKTLIPMRVGSTFGWRINNLFALPFQIFELTRKETILHVHAPTSVAKPFSVSLINKLSKKPMILDLHDPWSGHLFPLIGSFDLALRTELMRYAINSADYVVTAHTALMDLVRSISPRKPVSLVPNGVDLELFRPRPKNELIAKKVGISEHDLVVAFIGHITKDKGLDILAKSAYIVAKKWREIKFLIVGDGPFLKDVRHLADQLGLSKRFLFTGFVSKKTLVDYLSLADVCVAPYTSGPWYKISRVETPLKVVEYMAMEKPVVMSRISEENVITWSGGGLLVTPGDASELASSIVELIEDEKLRNRIGENGRKYIEKNYSWAKITETLMKIYYDLNDHT